MLSNVLSAILSAFHDMGNAIRITYKEKRTTGFLCDIYESSALRLNFDVEYMRVPFPVCNLPRSFAR